MIKGKARKMKKMKKLKLFLLMGIIVAIVILGAVYTKKVISWE